MEIKVINLKEKAELIDTLHSYKRVAVMNDYDFKMVRFNRTFVWHKHPETDQVFFVVKGTFNIELRDRTLTITSGDLAVVPKNVEHRPVAKEECTLLLIEPTNTVNTGDAGGSLTDTDVEWI